MGKSALDKNNVPIPNKATSPQPFLNKKGTQKQKLIKDSEIISTFLA